MSNHMALASRNHILLLLSLVAVLFFTSVTLTLAASLSISPNTGVHTSNSTFTVRVTVNSSGQSINAAEGTLSFNPRELSVVSVNRSSSIFNLWVTEPTFSNSAGTISFSGGSPSGYTGSGGTIMSVTFRAIGSGPARVTFSNGSVLANDGRGSNVLTSMNSGTFTIQAASTAPEPEQVIVEYVAPANTPGAPSISSNTHPDPTKWYTNRQASLSWNVPAGVTGVRTLLNSSPSAVPTRVYESPIDSINLDLDEGVSYFHLQFRNADGWGRVSSYRLAVDSSKPTAIEITQPEGTDYTNPEQKLQVSIADDGSTVKRFMVRINNNEPFEIIRENESDSLVLGALEPGYQTIIIEAFDEAGNSIIGTYSLTIEAFEKPVFTEFPSQINEEVIPVIKGTTRPNSKVTITVTKLGSEPVLYEVESNEGGEFTFIPEGRFASGVYELTAFATDQFGARSETSDVVRIAVQQPGFIRVGTFIVSVLSVIIPLLALTALLILGSWYGLVYYRRFRGAVRRESREALDIAHREFAALKAELRKQETTLMESRKTKKLTKAEADMIQVIDLALTRSQQNVEKEMTDVTNLTND